MPIGAETPLRSTLDPKDVMGEGYPSETFRVLKNNEMKEFGEYRTQRLVLEAWDRFWDDGTFTTRQGGWMSTPTLENDGRPE